MVSFQHILKILSHKKLLEAFIAVVCIGIGVVTLLLFYLNDSKTKIAALSTDKSEVEKAYEDLKNEDQYKINQQLNEDLKNTHDTYSESIEAYEGILELQVKKQDVSKLTPLYASIVNSLSDLNYASAESELTDLNAQIKKINDDLAAKEAALRAAGAPATPATASNTPPGSGYSYQAVSTEIGTYNIALVAADLNSTRVIIDTASDGTCTNDCPTLPLATYVQRSGAFAGINGSYFCPAEYPSCAGKTNSFDTLLMNKNKVYFNSDNNVYSNVPVAVFGAGFARFIGASSGWGRDTGVDGVIANQPLLLSGGNIAFGGGSDPKQGSKGARSFVGNKGSTVYIGVIYNVTVAEMAYVLKALGLENALNLDSGGSTALWSGGYKAGPGRNIPNAILFVGR
ncbi:MAG TPA: phosphodiester glycosidase family protein [Patescibacteria group bacterium]|nr:phosphodiester glycosidase family protein [Patescibacteria group bacterium]